VLLHVLPAGASFDLTARALVPRPPTVDPEDAAELAEAQHDMRQLARDIAAADASPAALRRRQARQRTKIEPNPDQLEGPVS
jgi:cyanophycinase